MTSFFKTENLKLHYRAGPDIIRAVDGVSLEISTAGEALALIGESGCGKSSAALALLRLLPNNVAMFSGQAWLNGEELLSLPEADFRSRIRWKRLAWVPQNTKGSLDPMYTVQAQFEELFKTHGIADARDRIRELLKAVGLAPAKARTIPDRLSGGEIQRVCIALAVALRPPLIILDEPTSALDPSLKGQIISLLSDLKRQFGCSFIFITHDIHQASSICESFTVMYAGKIVEQGRREEVLSNPMHPYTKKLLECVGGGAPRTEVTFIPGEPPDLKQPQAGCAFEPRCHRTTAECRVTAPTLVDIGGGHFAACHNVERL